ncbi:peptidase C45 [Hypericibacter adhaerens]|jgi:predicted choloylglycine hydrolase|uniref:Peptidase C45 n=1 Tax=Hypericibacter adhaerens TaxID=2602016 RepID=A0A5J6MZS5_9PROT|nr:C45 family peptidase [Hypericibacter adhaerens]QEX23079.1 peptidase C45 [Hypericibacter adhaerens]
MARLAVAEIGGSARERGRQHGRQLKALVRERDRRWRAEIEAFMAMPADRFIGRFLAETRFVAAIERHAPDLLEEVRGIAEGAELPEDALLAAQFMDEEWWYSVQLKQRREAAGTAHHCSGIASLTPGGGALLAQNMDLARWSDGLQALLLIRDIAPGLDAYVLTMAGMIGLCGVNSAGLAVTVNTLGDLNSASDGLPVAFVSRTLLARTGYDEAARFLGEIRHASGQNYILSDGRQLGDFECSTDHAVAFTPQDAAPGCLWHTNHALANRDLLPPSASEEAARFRRNTRQRLAALETRLKGRAAPFEQAVIRETLASQDDPDNPVSVTTENADRRRSGFFTFASVIWEIGPEIRAHVAPGAPSQFPYESFRLERSATRRAVAE